MRCRRPNTCAGSTSVDKGRIALAGYSWGDGRPALANSRHWGGTLARADASPRPRPSIRSCFTIRPRNAPEYESPPGHRHAAAGVADGRGTTRRRRPRIASRAWSRRSLAGAPVQLYVYPQATQHCWDCRNLDGYSKVDVRGNRVAHIATTARSPSSARRLFEFPRAGHASRRAKGRLARHPAEVVFAASARPVPQPTQPA